MILKYVNMPSHLVIGCWTSRKTELHPIKASEALLWEREADAQNTKTFASTLQGAAMQGNGWSVTCMNQVLLFKVLQITSHMHYSENLQNSQRLRQAQ